MMDNSIFGRDLDVAVARAMDLHPQDEKSVRRGQCWVPNIRFVTGMDWAEKWRPTPKFGTDPATLDEMDLWLSAHDQFPPTLTFKRVVDDERSGTTIWTGAMLSSYVDGTTLNLAAARLVVAVKEAMGEDA